MIKSEIKILNAQMQLVLETQTSYHDIHPF